jgi:hypothetical protein
MYLQLSGSFVQPAAEKSERLSGRFSESLKDVVEKLTAGADPSALETRFREFGEAAEGDFNDSHCLFESTVNVFLAVAESIYNNLSTP